ncbi:hypothetical protein FHX08_002402 [Rhizobium sp. BK529]|nr:hypothetical protein [Rhizobium sp. BK529]TCS06481.1 hypothetical protein EV281_10284 [Rhizobium sp. BK418]
MKMAPEAAPFVVWMLRFEIHRPSAIESGTAM